jgi:hypothetical protein
MARTKPVSAAFNSAATFASRVILPFRFSHIGRIDWETLVPNADPELLN